MRTNEEIGKAVTQGFLFINGEKYYITEVKRVGGASIFIIIDESATLSAGVDTQSDNWTAEPAPSAEDKIRLEVLAELGYNYIEVSEDCVHVCKRNDFLVCCSVYCFDNLPDGRYEITENYGLRRIEE